MAHVHLTHSQVSPEGNLFRANKHLSQNEPELARELYTKVLYELAPGHPIAFLNRSLAYLALGYPELAVVDAYRAGIVTHEFRGINADQNQEDGQSADDIARKISYKRSERYLRMESMHRSSGEQWATGRRMIGCGWLNEHLASIDIGSRDYVGHSKSEHICTDLEVRALFRMAGSLWRCGYGALRDALDIIEDTMQRYKLSFHDKQCFDTLGSDIFRDVMARRGPSENGQTMAEISFRQALKTRSTFVRREVYPWNADEPDLLGSGTLNKMQSLLRTASMGMKAVPLQSAQDKMPVPGLIATGNIYHGQPFFTEISILHANTGIDHKTKGRFCSVCSAMMASTAEQNSHGLSAPLQAIQLEPNLQRTQPTVVPAESRFKMCSICTPGCYFCTMKCFRDSEVFHPTLCDSSVENSIRKYYKNARRDVEYSLHDDPKTRCLIDLLFVRIIALATHQNQLPLKLDEVYWLGGDFFRPPMLPSNGISSYVFDADGGRGWHSRLSPPDEDDPRRTLPWSFHANVTRPIYYFDAIGLYHIERLELYDGWVINTLRAKIMHSMKITKGARHMKIYDIKDDHTIDVVTGCEEVEVLRAQEGLEETWVGSLHSKFGAIGIADEENGEKVNMCWIDDGCIRAYGDDKKRNEGRPTRLAFTKGEWILRGPDAVHSGGWTMGGTSDGLFETRRRALQDLRMAA